MVDEIGEGVPSFTWDDVADAVHTYFESLDFKKKAEIYKPRMSEVLSTPLFDWFWAMTKNKESWLGKCDAFRSGKIEFIGARKDRYQICFTRESKVDIDHFAFAENRRPKAGLCMASSSSSSSSSSLHKDEYYQTRQINNFKSNMNAKIKEKTGGLDLDDVIKVVGEAIKDATDGNDRQRELGRVQLLEQSRR